MQKKKKKKDEAPWLQETYSLVGEPSPKQSSCARRETTAGQGGSEMSTFVLFTGKINTGQTIK